ncbi:hypothetical protein AAEU32_03775 [Pseudoalteromonas sp. SSDWG2]|uniref:hypothetical protein n=1 Tax=Pseudoalteromonas sp. SSDWG2 TaxID=3139391 RepID=UPI003BAC839C
MQIRATAYYSDNSSYDVTEQCIWIFDDNISLVSGYVTATNFIEGYNTPLRASYQGIESDDTIVTMVASRKSAVIGRETSFVDEIALELHPAISFQGSAVIDGIYDANTKELLAGGTGGGQNPTDQNAYGDIMNLNQVTSVTGIAGTQWGGSKGSPLLQLLRWQEGEVNKKVGKFEVGETTTVVIDSTIIGIKVYSSAADTSEARKRRYVAGIQFIYR